MKRDSFSIAFACALGALIGTLVAMEISLRFEYGQYFWGVGALIGGIVAYVTIDFRHFCAGIVHACQVVATRLQARGHKIISWRPNLLWWATLLSVAPVIFVGTQTIMVMFYGMTMLVLFGSGLDPSTIPDSFYTVSTPLFIVGVPTLVTLIGFIPVGIDMMHGAGCLSGKDSVALHETIRDNGKTFLILNIFFIVSFLVYILGLLTLVVLKALVSSIPLVIARTPNAVFSIIKAMILVVKVTKEVVAEIFVYVHSRRRTICFVDATVGAIIGYSCGSAVIGAIVGALLGIINYELISVRWLKLVPSR